MGFSLEAVLTNYLYYNAQCHWLTDEGFDQLHFINAFRCLARFLSDMENFIF